MKYFSSSLILIWVQPATQHVPIPRATTAACDVLPPLPVKIPWEAVIPSISSGVVSNLTSTTLSPWPPFPCFLASNAVNTTLPAAAPGEAGRASPISIPSFRASSLNVGCNNWSKLLASILNSASFSVIIFSSIKSHAIFMAALAVLFPFLVCNIYNFPSSIVNSISCISR